MKSSFNSILEKAVVGKTIAKQNGIHENYWGATIKSVSPCELNYGCDVGYLIITNSKGCNYFNIQADFAIELE